MKNNNFKIIHDDISNAKCDIIVNASNGVGYMGGKMSVKCKMRGVAESLNYFTKGEIEKESLINARKFPRISSWVIGKQKGEFFVTEGHGLKCDKVFHAVTMRYPACRSDLKTVQQLLFNLAMWCSENHYKTVALPLLGCGNGNLDNNIVRNEIYKIAKEYSDITFYLYIGK